MPTIADFEPRYVTYLQMLPDGELSASGKFAHVMVPGAQFRIGNDLHDWRWRAVSNLQGSLAGQIAIREGYLGD